MVTLEEMKNYLRVDFDEDDSLIESLIETSKKLVLDVARGENLSDLLPFEDQVKTAILYSVSFLYEHREEANFKDLTLSLRSLLFGVRKDGF